MIKRNFEAQYQWILEETLRFGELKSNRTNVDAHSIFNQSLTADLRKGFPIVTGKKIFFDKARAEYEWMRDGLTHTTYLKLHDIHWWDQYADSTGYLGKTYGYQIRSFNGEKDQLDYVHRQLRMNTRRAHVTFWNPSDLETMELPPCYTGMTFRRVDEWLDMTMQFRSSDLFLGLPYDIVVAACFLIDIADFNELKPRFLGVQITDAHLYKNHFNQAVEYLKQDRHNLPIFYKDEGKIKLHNYKHGPYIKAPLNN